MEQIIKIKTEKNLCGDEYLSNGELTLNMEDEHAHLVTMEDDSGFKCVVSVTQLQTAINKLRLR